MSRTAEELFQALIDLSELPHGKSRSAGVEQVVAEIEAQDLRRLLPFAYFSLVDAYHRGPERPKSFVTFSKQLRLYDSEPELFDEQDVHLMLWSFKWMTQGLWKFPSVPRQQIEQTIDDMGRRYALVGQGPSAVHDVRFYYAVHRGDWAAAEQLYETSLACPRDECSDCEACTPSARASYHLLRGEEDEALRLLDPVLSGGLTCGDEPHVALGMVLLPYVRAGRVDDARAAHLKGYRMVRNQREFQDTIALHLQFLALTGNEARGLEILAEHRDLLASGDHPLAELEFVRAAGLLLRRVAEVSGADAPVSGPDGPATAGPLADWARQRALSLAAAFDQRNGSGWRTAQTQQILDAQPLLGELRLGLSTVSSSEETPAAPVPVIPDGITAELIGAEGLDAEALAAHADELTDAGHPAAQQVWDRLANGIGDDADPRLLARISEGIGRMIATTDPAAGREQLREAAQFWESVGDDRALAITRGRLAIFAALLGDIDTAHENIIAADEVLTAVGTPAEQLDHLFRRANIAMILASDDDDRAEAVQLLREHTTRARELGLAIDAAESKAVLLDEFNDAADADEATASWTQVAEAFRAAGRGWRLPHILVRLTQARLAAGWLAEQPDIVIGTLAEAVSTADSWGITGAGTYAAYLRADLMASDERFPEAARAAFEAVVRAEDSGEQTLLALSRSILGRVYAALDRYDEAVHFLEAALPGLPETDQVERYHAHSALGRAYHELVEVRQSAKHFATASEIAEAAGEIGAAASAARQAASALDNDDPAAAAAAYERAASLFGAAEQPLGVVRMYRAQAAALARTESADDALKALDLAAEAVVLVQPGDDVDPRWERAEIDDQSARVLASAGRGVEAVHRALSAEQGHLDAEAPDDAAYAATLAAQVTLELLEDPAAAEPVARRGLAHAEAADHDQARVNAAMVLAEVLDAQQRGAEAEELRRSVGMLDDEDHDHDDDLAD